MLSSLIIASGESSKTAFYVAGGVLAGFAVLLSVIGMTQPDFPKGDGAYKGIIGLAAVLVIGACAATIITA